MSLPLTSESTQPYLSQTTQHFAFSATFGLVGRLVINGFRLANVVSGLAMGVTFEVAKRFFFTQLNKTINDHARDGTDLYPIKAAISVGLALWTTAKVSALAGLILAVPTFITTIGTGCVALALASAYKAPMAAAKPQNATTTLTDEQSELIKGLLLKEDAFVEEVTIGANENTTTIHFICANGKKAIYTNDGTTAVPSNDPTIYVVTETKLHRDLETKIQELFAPSRTPNFATNLASTSGFVVSQ